MRAAALTLLTVLTACDDSPTAPSDTTTPSLASVVFQGSLEPGGTAFYAYSASQNGTVTVTFASLTLVSRSAALPLTMQIGSGVPAGEGCAVSDSVETSPALTPQFSPSVSAGIHCVAIADIGLLPGPATFLIRFTHP